MNKLYFWIGLALLGFLLYIAPGYLVRKMYEGFESPAIGTNAATLAESTAPLLGAPCPAPKPSSALLGRMAYAGSVEPDSRPSPTAPEPIVGGAGSRATPLPASTSLSQPGSPRDVPQASEALEQGAGFLESKPFPADLDIEQKTQRVLGNEVVGAASVVQGFANPSCPDMRDYIRKDKIPCWACTLK